ncbi:hypothetical protein ACROYT_G028875 [Oculina patagonica]
MADPGKIVKVGSRKSQLALIQTNVIVEELKKTFSDISFEIVSMSTVGDNVLDKALPKIGERSLFTKELEVALANKSVDLVVHSLKDLPSTLPPGMLIGAVFRRDSPYDVVVFHPKHKGSTLATLPKGSVIGTSSLRRSAQLQKAFAHLIIEDVRGNLNTRLSKLDAGDKYDALILAAAGMERMGWAERIEQVLSADECLYAVGQGALAVEVRLDDKETIELVSKLIDNHTSLCCAAERNFLRTLEGGCSVPIGVTSSLDGNQMTITGAVFSLDGKECIKETVTGILPDPAVQDGGCPHAVLTESSIYVPEGLRDALVAAEKLGDQLARALIDKGAVEVLRKAREEKDLAH